MKQIRHLLFILAILTFTYTGFAQYNFNYAAIFNGSNSYIAVPNGLGVTVTNAVTIEAWVYLLSYTSTGSAHTIYAKNYQSSNALFILGAGSGAAGKVRFYPRGGIGQFFQSTSIIPLNTWTHVCATYDGANTKIYLNGFVDASSTAFSGNIGTNTDSVFIGCDRDGASRNYFFNGYIDEVRLWSIAKTPADILRDLHVSLGTISPGGVYGGIQSIWRMNNNTTAEGGNNFLSSNGFERNISYLDLRQKPVNYIDYNGTLVLNGTTDYCASIAFSTAYSSPNAITLEAWIKRDTTGAQPGFENIVNRSGGTTRYDYAMYINSSGSLFLDINNGVFGISKANVITLGRWYHVAATYNSATGTAKLFVNGDSVASTVFSGNPLINDNTSDNAYVGGIGATNLSANKFKGQIDEVRIWKNTERGSSEIKGNMYNNLNFTTPSLPTNLIVFGFDGMNYNARVTPGTLSEYLFFFGGAYISSAHSPNFATPVSPLLRDDAGGFPSTNYFISTKRYFTPNGNTSVTDSVFIPSGGLITGVKLFTLINKISVSDLSLTLIAPNGTSANIFTNSGGFSFDMMTIFSDAADSLPGTIGNGGFIAPFSPLVKPNNPLSVFNNINRQGWWKLRITQIGGGVPAFVNGWGIQANIVTGIQQNTQAPDRFGLSQNYPNPFNPATNIKYTLPKDVNVKITIYDILGQEVSVPVNGFKKAGSYEFTFDGTNLSSGVYFYKAAAGDFTDIKKMTLLK
jgi:hypothetical protein